MSIVIFERRYYIPLANIECALKKKNWYWTYIRWTDDKKITVEEGGSSNV